MGSLGEWLRKNSEPRLMDAAQKDLARRYLGRDGPVRRSAADDVFWNTVFVPVYRKLPWAVRRFVLRRLPGSHHRRWRGGNPL